jgi:hypothetical protein
MSYGLSSNPVHIEMLENLTLTSPHQTTIMALESNYTVQATLERKSSRLLRIMRIQICQEKKGCQMYQLLHLLYIKT